MWVANRSRRASPALALSCVMGVVMSAAVIVGLPSASGAVGATATTSSLTPLSGTANVGAPITLTDKVSPPGGATVAVTGSVTFQSSEGPICSDVALTAGIPATATCTFFSEQTGTNPAISAVYSGDSNYAASTTPNGSVQFITAGPVPALSANPNPVTTLPAVGVGEIGNPVTVTLTNSGTSGGYDVMDGMTFAGADPNDFIGASDCFSGSGVSGTDYPVSVAPGGQCSVQIGLAPNAVGTRTGTLVIAMNNGAGSLQLALSGTGLDGYQEVTAQGRVFSYGNADQAGDLSGESLNKPIVGMADTGDGGGYWILASDGGIFAEGDAQFFGSTGSIALNKPIVGMAPTTDSGGYWEVASDGGIFSYGDANFFGSTGNIVLNKPIVGMAATPDGGGYWLVATDGGIFAFGDAKFYGSAGNIVLNRPIVGMAASPTGHGYRLVASDGGIFNYGDAQSYGSAASSGLQDFVGMVDTSPPDVPFSFGVFGNGPEERHELPSSRRAYAEEAGPAASPAPAGQQQFRINS